MVTLFQSVACSPRNRCAVAAVVAAMLVWTAKPCQAQGERYELGKRLRRFEEAWQTAPGDTKTQSSAILQQAVRNFFSLNLLGAAEQLDQAWIVTREEKTPNWQTAVIPYRVQSSVSLLDQTVNSFTLSLSDFYKGKEPVPDAAKVSWRIVDDEKRVLSEGECSFIEASKGITVDTRDLGEGDYHLQVVVLYDSLEFELPSKMICRVNDWTSRASRLTDIARNQELSLDDSLRATLRDHGSLINQVGKGSALETDYPVHQILALDESLAADPASLKEKLLTAAGQHDVWVTLAKGRSRVPVRVRCPSAGSGQSTGNQPLPVLFLMHGAGGSENMFFETYGAGGAVTAGLHRGWLVVAPRQGFTGLALDCQEMLDALDSLFEIDRKQIYIIGHSMGAAQVIRQATLHPQLIRAAAVIGGGSGVRNAEQISGIAWYVAAGELDFGKPGAQAFYQSMKFAKTQALRYEEFPGIEHLVIVQACLQDLFSFFDSVRVSAFR